MKARGQVGRNFIAEWFGYRMYPTTRPDPLHVRDQRAERCPFLSRALREESPCVKRPNARGICTIAGPGDADWLVCPHRALDGVLLDAAARRLFGTEDGPRPLVIPAPSLGRPDVRYDIEKGVGTGVPIVVYAQSQLGGEVSIAGTAGSPPLAFDTTFVEVVQEAGRLQLGRFGILEIQTMDFHGTYQHALRNLTQALELHPEDFAEQVNANQWWLSDRVEGPNIANVFKRTFYQAAFKFRLAAHEKSAGCILALPSPVWDSWRQHLGGAELDPQPGGKVSVLRAPPGLSLEPSKAWIFVFEIDRESTESPNAIILRQSIVADAASVTYYALEAAPEMAIEQATKDEWLHLAIEAKLAQWWPELAADRGARKAKTQKLRARKSPAR